MNPTDRQRFSRLIANDISKIECERLTRYADWLCDEAAAAGAIGPNEADRIWDRHLLDSTAFLPLLESVEGTAVVDIGSGAGLPGIVVAILKPQTEVFLVDRSANRSQLQHRVIQILGLDNCSPILADVYADSIPDGIRVFRASLAPLRALELHINRPTPLASIVALSRAGEGTVSDAMAINAARADIKLSTRRIGSEILDSPGWFLIMRSK
ncbi:MAG: class I SAM-dependent methyltransferase [Acidobacteria bacterium]|nr:class I SAM-dependent methyltransferase [Acidobacteriota bacterium]